LNAVIIVAGGIGQRMGGLIPKQFLMLNDLPVIFHSVKPFIEFDPKINVIVVLPNDHINTWITACNKYGFHVEHEIVVGGETRYQSVKNGLQFVNNADFTAIHDSVRPLINKEFVKCCFESAKQKGNAVPCVGINETVRKVDSLGNTQLDRSILRLIQTPQVFNTKTLNEAYKLPFSDKFTDDASVVEALGEKINLIDGLKQNVKITTDIDFKIAEYLITK
jgi:2-C-methyl-D-erythritol 4-phosphate cytidylyltransferase